MTGTCEPATAKAVRGKGCADGWRPAAHRMIAAAILALALHANSAAQTSPHGEIAIACEDCHTAQSWNELARPMKFDHASTGFKLRGQHELVQCRSCHTSFTFKGTNKQCSGCHDDLHRGELGVNCVRCHSPQSWVIPDMAQRHSSTAFPLVGQHLTADCQRCHPNQQKHQYVGVHTDCYSCHAADYEGSQAPNHRAAGFSTDCSQCHAVNAARWGGDFDHARTGFPLQGAHVTTPCSRCHTGNNFHNAGTQCVSCHQQQFTAATSPKHTGFPTDCLACHSMTAWRPALFDHTRTNFRLTGAHLAVACNQCHKNGVFAGTASQCSGCHQAQATAVVTPSHTGFPNDCATCHTTTAWRPSTFDHTRTTFQLTGAHVAVACNLCHKNAVYAGTPTTCGNSGCHLQNYSSATNPVHGTGFSTECATCHTTTAWRPATFDHSKASFPLTGAHLSAQCALCHKNGIYTGTPNTCGNAGCHLTQYNATASPSHIAAAFPLECQVCHTTTAWKPSTWNHDPYFPISAGSVHSPGRWNACTDCHTVPTTYTAFSCINCHEHSSQTNVDGHHTGVAGYSYNSAACYHCHPQGRSGGGRR